MTPSILIAEDEPEVRNFLRVALRQEEYRVEFAEDGDEVLSYVRTHPQDLSLLMLDLFMPRRDGMSTLQEVRRAHPHLPIVILSGTSGPATVAQAMRCGASEFLSKPVSHERLRSTIRNLLQTGKPLGRETQPAVRADATASGLPTWPRKIETLVKGVAASNVPVLIQGETGVGKEVLARQIHSLSPRANRPFLKLNCAALPAELVESELFGYDRGAFTGAVRNNPGKFEMAHGGTILLDEIGDMSFPLQAKLLQVLQDHEFLRLGAKEPVRVDVRVIAATHCDLETAILERRFREDLYYRLNIAHFVIPPLRERRDEICRLAAHFLEKHSTDGIRPPELTPTLQNALLQHDWPGNIRELENTMRRYLVLRHAPTIVEDLQHRARRRANPVMPVTSSPMLMETLPRVAVAEQPVAAAPPEPAITLEKEMALEPAPLASVPAVPAPAALSASVLDQVEAAHRKAEVDAILAVLNRTLWNRKQAAKLLQIDYKALLYKMKKLGIGEKPLEA